jgi:hypothetical protein
MEQNLHAAWRRVIAMVVQPGVDFDHSHIQHYDAAQAAALSALSPASRASCSKPTPPTTSAKRRCTMVRDHFAILKVGPAATFALREALMALCQIEAELVPASQVSRLMQVLDDTMLAQPKHWPSTIRAAARTAPAAPLRPERPLPLLLGRSAGGGGGEKLVANLDALEIPLSLLSQHLPEQYLEVLQGQLAPSANALLEHKIAACWRSTRAPATATQQQPITLLLAAQLHLLSCLFDRFTANHATYQPTPRFDFAGAHTARIGAGQPTGGADGRVRGDHPQRPQCTGIPGPGNPQPRRRRLARTPPTEHTVPQKDAINHEQKSHRRLRGAHGAAGR